MATLDIFLTVTGRRGKVRLMEDALATLVSQALEGRSIHDGAQRCGLPDHQLRDVVYKKSKRPAPAVLSAISEGLEVPYENLALAAYGIIKPHRDPDDSA